MKIEQYDKVMLKTGKTASIVEVWEEGIAYEADIDVGEMEWETETIRQEDIYYVFADNSGYSAKAI